MVIERTLASDLLSELHTRLTVQGQAVSAWLSRADHPDQLVRRLATTTGTRVTVIGSDDGLVQADSVRARHEGPYRSATRQRSPWRGGSAAATAASATRSGALTFEGELRQYLVAVPSENGRVVRLSVPIDNVLDTRARMRNAAARRRRSPASSGCVLLSFIFIRALTRPLQSMTHAANRLAQGD